MLYLLGGFAILGGLLMLVYLFVNADPARLARNLRWAGITIAGIAVVALILLPPAREFAALLLPLAMATPLLARIRTVLDRHRPPSGGQTSTVATAFLRMTLEHDTGRMEGTILRGRFAGMRLEELGPADLLALLRECRAEDEEGARLLEAYPMVPLTKNVTLGIAILSYCGQLHLGLLADRDQWPDLETLAFLFEDLLFGTRR